VYDPLVFEIGFKIEKFDRGVAMIPKPKSEAWLLCALRNKAYENCQKLEDRSGNDDSPNSLKKELDALGIENSKINEMSEPHSPKSKIMEEASFVMNTR